MFAKQIMETSLTSQIADAIFGKITSDTYNGDVSFCATLRALLANRIGEDSIRVKYSHNTWNADQINHNDSKTIFGASVDQGIYNCIEIHNVKSSTEAYRRAFFDKLDNDETSFVRSYPGYVELTAIRECIAKQVNVRVYTNADIKRTVIFVEQLNTRIWHYLQCFTVQYCKWYFKDNPISKEEQDLLVSLSDRYPAKYEELIETIASNFDFRTYLIDKVVMKFEKQARQRQLENVEHRIQEAAEELQYLLDQYREKSYSLDDLRVQRMGLNSIIESGEDNNELADYFRSHKMLDPVDTRGSHLSFIVRTYLDGYDPEMYETIAKNQRSHLYRNYSTNGVFDSVENRKKLMDAIFSDDPVLKVKMCAFYDLDIRGSVESAVGYHFPRNCADYIPNPHLHHHDCLGDHRRFIMERLKENDLLGAIEQCISSAKSINIGEDVTVKYFLEDLFTTSARVIEVKDGRSLTPTEALAWLEEYEKEA